MITLFEECGRLGGVYVKFLQQLAVTEMASEHFVAYGKHLEVYDKVPFEPLDLRRTLENELGCKLELLADIETSPFSSGSFAQVYSARIKSTNAPVVIKVLRPSIVANLRIDSRLLLFLSYVAQTFVRNGLMSLPAIARQFIDTLKQETDYLHEAVMADYIYDYFKHDNGDVIVPVTYRDLSTDTVLVQERIYGLPLTDIVSMAHQGVDTVRYAQQITGSDLRVQLRTVGVELLTAALQADYIMSDPHPGNIILLGNNKIALIDFGLTTKAPAHRGAVLGMIGQYRALYEDRADMGELAVAMMAFYDYDLYEALNIVVKNGEITDSLSNYVSSRIVDLEVKSSRLYGTKQITQLFLRHINVNNRFGIRIDERDIVLQKAMHNFLSTTRMACGEAYRTTYYWDIVKSALTVAEETANRMGIKDSSSSLASSMSLEDAQEVVVDWLSAVAERDQMAYRAVMRGGVA